MRVNDIDIPPGRPVLIAGPTASGKSALALRIAEAEGGVILNADAIQVYANWRVLTARPTIEEEARIKHHLFGHITSETAYSAGAWLRELADILKAGGGQEKLRPIIVGGTGLYFLALTEGLAEIPQTPAAIRAQSDALRLSGHTAQMIEELDTLTRAQIDLKNPMRVQRAWEVLRSTGRGLATWQAETPPPLLPISQTVPLVLDASKNWLTPRIEQRFDQMLAEGALEEARENLQHWDPGLPSAKAIGAPELIAHLKGEMSLASAKEAATIATRQFAKRQRTWFRARMKAWHKVEPADL